MSLFLNNINVEQKEKDIAMRIIKIWKNEPRSAFPERFGSFLSR